MNLFFKNLIGISIIVAIANIILPSGKMKRTSEIVMSIIISFTIILNLSNIKFENIKIQDFFNENYNYQQEYLHTNTIHQNMIENILDDNKIEYIKAVCNYNDELTLSSVEIFLKEKNEVLENKIKELITREYVFLKVGVDFLYE